MNDKIDAVDAKLTGKLDNLKDAFAELRVSRAFDRVWFVVMSAALLGIMARAFKWV
jgi:hypothetical protein